MTRTYQETITLQELVCDECGITFATPKDWLAGKQRTSATFYCPNGHILLCYSESTETRMEKQLQAERELYRKLQLQLTSTNDQLQATKRELQRHKKRVGNGVCPCCNRSFVKLQQHMKTKHPEYSLEESR